MRSTAGTGLHSRIGSLVFSLLILLVFILFGLPSARGESTEIRGALKDIRIPILLYHRFGPVASDSMTVTTPVFESHMRYLRDQGYSVISLRHLVDACLGKEHISPSRPVVMTVDDGHKSVYTDLYPLLKKYRIPVTLFLYPSALSNASYAMTWDQVREMKETGLVDLQSHTFWHPNFKNEKKRLRLAEYEGFVEMQLKKSKESLEKEFKGKVDMLAWPFGIYDGELMSMAARAGYVAALSIDRRRASLSDNAMALPRYLINNRDQLSRYGL